MSRVDEFLLNYGDILFAAVLIYLALISLFAVIVTIADKIRSKNPGKRRVPEDTLMLISACGGSLAMLITMLMIRHKTRHIKFMLGIPAIILVQVVLLYILIFRVNVFGMV